MHTCIYILVKMYIKSIFFKFKFKKKFPCAATLYTIRKQTGNKSAAKFHSNSVYREKEL